MPEAGFESAVPASERPQTHALDRAATGIGNYNHYRLLLNSCAELVINARVSVLLFQAGRWMDGHEAENSLYSLCECT
jgi:hypothetical protein